MTRVWEHGPDDPTERYVLVTLADSANDEGVAWPMVMTIVEKTMLSKRTVLRTLTALEDAGWLAVKRKAKDAKRSVYLISLDRLSGATVSPKPANDSGATVSPTQVPSCHSQVPLCHRSPTPPNRKNRHEPSVEPKPLPVAPRPAADERHVACRTQVHAYWAWNHPGASVGPWDASDAKALARLLAANPALTLQEFAHLLDSRHASEVNHSERPRMWLERLTDYSAGPLDRYGKPLELDRKRSAATVGVHSAERNMYSEQEIAEARLLARYEDEMMARVEELISEATPEEHSDALVKAAKDVQSIPHMARDWPTWSQERRRIAAEQYVRHKLKQSLPSFEQWRAAAERQST